MRRNIALVFLGLGPLAGCPADDAEGSSDTEDGTSTGGMSGTMPSTVGMSASGASTSSSSSSSSTTDDTTTTEPSTESMTDPTTTSGSTTDTDTDADTGSGSTSGSTGGGDATYPPCNNMLMCEDPYDACYSFVPGYTLCTMMCEQGGDPCPDPSGGDAVSTCSETLGQCVLDCEGDVACPDGMDCVEVPTGLGNVFRCLWPI